MARERWEVEWTEPVSTGALEVRHLSQVFATEAEARVFAHLKAKTDVFGCVTVSKQRLTNVEGTSVADWEDVSEDCVNG